MTFIRILVTVLLCAAAIIAGDALFRVSLLQEMRPIILSPPDHAIVDPPVQLRWEGPERMQVLLAVAGEDPRDLGVHQSPLDLGSDEFPRDGGYQLEIRSPRFGDWIRAQRWFQVQAPAPPAPTPAARDHKEDEDLVHAIEDARAARARAEAHVRRLRDENAALQEEHAQLTEQMQSLSQTHEDDAARQADLEQRMNQLAQENRALADENGALRQRLGSVIPCTVWGYFSYPWPQTIPLTRRVLMVSDLRGQVFRSQMACETLRRVDVTAASICFCVGNSFGG